jgi:hypothetical protein
VHPKLFENWSALKVKAVSFRDGVAEAYLLLHKQVQDSLNCLMKIDPWKSVSLKLLMHGVITDASLQACLNDIWFC